VPSRSAEPASSGRAADGHRAKAPLRVVSDCVKVPARGGDHTFSFMEIFNLRPDMPTVALDIVIANTGIFVASVKFL